MYRQRLPGHDLSIQQNTPEVPNDGYYYVLHQREQRRFRTLVQAKKCYDAIKDSLGFVPPPPPEPPAAEELMRRELATQSNKSLIWTDEDFTRVSRKTQGRPKH